MEEIKKSVLGGEKMKKVIYIVGMIALIAAMMVMPVAAKTIYVTEAGWWIEGGAFNASSCPVHDAVEENPYLEDGDTVFVYNGTYEVVSADNDPLVIRKSITLKGEGADVVTFDLKHPTIGDRWYISIDADGTIVEGLKIVNGSTGISVCAPDCIVRNCVFEGEFSGGFGPIRVSATNFTFKGNVREGGIIGLLFDLPPDNPVAVTCVDNVIANTTKTYYAVKFKGSNSIVVNNTLINNAGGLGLYGDKATNITVARNNLISNGAGIKLYKAGAGNKIYLNNIVNCTESVKISQTTTSQFWNSTEPIEYVWNGTTYTGYLGNYWSDYTGNDSNGDGIGDTPYEIPGSTTGDKDYHPLMAPFENYLGAPAVPPTPPKPFVIHGWVNYSNGTPVLNPNVTITNMNTSEVFVANTSPDSNYYQVVTTSYNISAGDVLHFNVSDTNTTEFNHTVTQDEIDNGGFMQNITIVPPAVPMPDLLVTAINAYHNNTDCPAWFNLSNEIDVTVKNNGTGAANASNVSLYIDGVFFGKLRVPSLAAGANVTVTFRNWKPIGGDCLNPPCDFNWSYKEYNFTAIADCDGEVGESNETNNETTVVDRACYNGYMADEPLENVAHGMLNGHLIFTTGDGVYKGLYSVGSTQTTHYDINLPDGATTKLALLYVYYTWCKPASGVEYACPEMEVNITTPDGTTYTLPLERAYNDTKCTCPGAMWNYPFGTYVYNVTEYITANGTYTVTVKNVCTQCSYFCVAAPGLLILYEDTNAPLIEYWINEGADLLIGGRRSDGGYLAWWECINNATFPASSQTFDVANATLGVVAPWGGSSWEPGTTNHLFFNGIKLGTGVYHGFDSSYDETIDSITMHIGSTYAQVGVNVTDVTAYYMNGSDNVVGQADDGDCMMPAGAFLVVTYKVPAGICGDVTGDSIVDMGDVALLVNNVSYPGNPAYAINEWAGDVTGDGVLDMGDVALLVNNVSYPGDPAYNLNCR